MQKYKAKHRAFLILLLVYIAGVLATQSILPVLEGTADEQFHLNYVLYLQAEKRLPDRATYVTNSMQQETGQPPLTYWVAAVTLDLLGVPAYRDNPLDTLYESRNFWFTPVDWPRRADNYNYFVHGENEEAFGNPDIVRANRITRLLSLLYGILAMIGSYNAAHELFRPRWALVATVVFALTPQMLYMSAILSNDISAMAFATLTIWQTLALLRRGASITRLIVIGILLGLSGLSKVNTLLLAPGVGLALVLDWHKRRYPIGKLILHGLIVAGIVTVMIGPWVWFGLSTFNDPFGFRPHNDPGRIPVTATVERVIVILPQLYLSYWGRLATNEAHLNPLYYGLMTVLIVLAVIGTVRQRPVLQRDVVIVLGAIALLTLVALIFWMRSLFAVSFAITGRLLYPTMHIIVALAIANGLYHLSATKWLRTAVIGLMASGVLLTPVALLAVYGMASGHTQQKPTLQGSELYFDDALTFTGYHLDNPYIYEGQFKTITLCWRVNGSSDKPATVLLKLYDAERNIIAERQTSHGLGRYTYKSWKPGEFCDLVDMHINKTLIPAQTYDLTLALMNTYTQQTDWLITSGKDHAKVDTAIIGKLVSPAGRMTIDGDLNWQKAAIGFPKFAELTDYAVDKPLVPGQTLNLRLRWNVIGRTPDNWSQFIHLIGVTDDYVLADGLPRNGNYPTWAWSTGEQIIDTWQLRIPETLARGNYLVKTGFYRQDTGERMPVFVDNHEVPDRSAVLLSFEVK